MSGDLTDILICDLGIAKLKNMAETTHTAVGNGPGTYPYMAPEMYKPSHRGSEVDIYSLGCLLIELFGGERVWKGLSSMEIMQKVCGSFAIPPQQPSVEHLKPQYHKLCSQCCHISTSERPRITSVLNEIKQMVDI